MRFLFGELLEFLLPSACAACGKGIAPEKALCPRCDAALPRIPRHFCVRCQERPASEEKPLCLACSLKPSPLAACVAAAPFAGEVERWIHRFKYPPPGLRGLDPAPLAVVSQLICEAAERVPGPPPELLVPIPLHKNRLRARGFNPAERLARALSKKLGVPCDPNLLERVRDTPSQTGFDRRARLKNVKGAFRIRRGRALPGSLWLVDDVVTTGSTLKAAAKELRKETVQTICAVCSIKSLISN